ncbi:hypothetical protein CERSUDRAFT_119481 [Gelatoporia subvermispora B]|uniref:Uncharacterized protein n=1 Tax=Ceriporiopsis subvermispora (strain B) TaxID=914234 RepID=M2P8F4_CERS8|nr:hypothetical protein CERSUDRAFT_119481 [Gelatoporia subvermispora B]
MVPAGLVPGIRAAKAPCRGLTSLRRSSSQHEDRTRQPRETQGSMPRNPTPTRIHARSLSAALHDIVHPNQLTRCMASMCASARWREDLHGPFDQAVRVQVRP